MDLARVTDETALARWHEVWRAVQEHDFVALPADPVEDLRPVLSGPASGEEVELWLATVGDRAVGAVQLRLPLHDNTDLANLALHLHPDHRGRGHGRQAAAAALHAVRETGRTQVLCEIPSRTRRDDPAPGETLARSLGARPLHAETRRLLDVSALAPDSLDALRDAAAVASAGYSAVGWRDHAPDEYADDMARLMALMSTDPPQGELTLEPEVWDVARFREHEDSVIARRRTHLTVAVRHDETGRIVGFSDLGIPAGVAEVGYQWSTIVAGEHRGHRLGMLAKVANLRQLRAALPHVRYLNTWNADENTYMVAVNEALGFRPMEQWNEWGLAIEAQARDGE